MSSILTFAVKKGIQLHKNLAPVMPKDQWGQLANPGWLGKWLLNWRMCVCMCVLFSRIL